MEARRLGQERFHAVGRLDDVGAGLALDVEDDGGAAIHPAGQADVFHVVDDLADVAERGRARRSYRRR